ncbi:MAG: superoxide dismutase family protein, partial [Candidatus Omnitrophota bacterium]|nr:superoxide dismutase family protein [Candidatus Omnitrophota bacterium]
MNTKKRWIIMFLSIGFTFAGFNNVFAQNEILPPGIPAQDNSVMKEEMILEEMAQEGGMVEEVVITLQATAAIAGTAEGSPMTGMVEFYEEPNGLRVETQIANAPAGTHGFHIHEHGSCDDEGKAAGGHFNPAGVPHGLLARDGEHAAHAGDL